MTSTSARQNTQLTFLVLVVGVTAYALLQSLVIPALPTLKASLHTSQSAVTWVVTAYLLAASIFTPIMGRLGDLFGKERMLVVTLAALAMGSLVAAVSHTLLVLLIGRCIQGVGGGAMPLSFGIVRDEFPPRRVPTTIGIIAAMTAVGGGVGLVITGPIIDALNYHWLFWIPLILTALAAVCSHLFVPESPVRTGGGVSPTAAVLLSIWLVALLVGVSEAPSWGWGSARVLALLGGAVVVGVAWVATETRVRHPLIDMRMMRVGAVWTNNLVAFLFGAGMYSVMAFLPEFLQTPRSSGYGFGASISMSGLFLLPLTVMMFLLGLFAGRFAERFGAKAAVIIGSGVSTAGYLVLALAHTQDFEIYLASTCLGVGLGLAYSAMSSLIVHAVPPSQTGVASGMNANIRTIGGAVGAAVTSSIVTASASHAGAGYTHGFFFMAAVSLLATFAALVIPTERADEPGEHHVGHAELAVVPGGTLVDD